MQSTVINILFSFLLDSTLRSTPMNLHWIVSEAIQKVTALKIQDALDAETGHGDNEYC